MRRFFKWFGIGVGTLFVLLFAAAFWLAGGPQEIWGELFPTQFYDNVEVKLVIDGEAVTVTGTAFCSISRRNMPIIAYRGGTTTRTGGAAVSVMSDGHAVVIPYIFQEYCRGPVAADGFPDRDYMDWWSVFDQRFSLKGNIDILIMDDGDNPSEMELILGPEYFRNSDASIKLISADRWRSKRGVETNSMLEWFNADKRPIDSSRWVGAFVRTLATEHYENDPHLEVLRAHLNTQPESKVPTSGNWQYLSNKNPNWETWPAALQGATVSWTSQGEPYRIPLVRRSANWYPNVQTVTQFSGCGPLVGLNGWFGRGYKEFFFEGRKLDVASIGVAMDEGGSRYLDRSSKTIIVGGKFCVDRYGR